MPSAGGGWKNSFKPGNGQSAPSSSGSSNSSGQSHPYSRNSAANRARRQLDQSNTMRAAASYSSAGVFTSSATKRVLPKSDSSAQSRHEFPAAPMTAAEYDAAMASQQLAYKSDPPHSVTPTSLSSSSSSVSTNLQKASSPSVTGSSPPVASPATRSPAPEDGPRLTVKRERAGMAWNDSSLLEWDPSHFRLFVGNLSPEVTDEMLYRAFKYNPNPRPGSTVNEARFPSLSKVRVVREANNQFKNKGYGFVSFGDPQDYFTAFKEMNGKYIGNHPIQLRKAITEIKPVSDKKKNKKGYQKNSGKNNANIGPQAPSAAAAAVASTTLKTTVVATKKAPSTSETQKESGSETASTASSGKGFRKSGFKTSTFVKTS